MAEPKDPSNEPTNDPTNENEPTGGSTGATSADTPSDPVRPATGQPLGGTNRWAPAVVTFVLGLLLGGIGWALLNQGDAAVVAGAPTAAPTATVTETVGEGGSIAPVTGVSCTYSPACAKVGDEGKKLQDLLSKALKAAQAIDANELSTIVRQIDTQQTALTKAVEACSGATVTTPSAAAS